MNKPHIEITTRIGCRANCTFCPQSKLLESYKDDTKVLSFDSFKKYLHKIPKNIDIHFSGMAEPFLNPDAMRMIMHSVFQGYNVSIFTTLQGLTLQQYEQLLVLDFDMFCVHIADDHGHTNIKVDEKYIELLDYINKHKPKAKKFWHQCHGVPHKGIRHLITMVDAYMIDRAGNVEHEMFTKTEIEGKFICTAGDFNQNILLPNGDVVLCCMDYGLEHFLGNLNDCSYFELNKSRLYDAMDGKCKALCHKCNRAKGVDDE